MARKKKIISVVGARPNFMKLAPLARELQKHSRYIQHIVVHTGQHYDYNLSRVFFRDMELPEPAFFLNAGSGSHARQTSTIMSRFESVLFDQKPDLVIVYGDVNSTLACSLACSKIKLQTRTIPCAHVESGLRSFDRTMPEEINRIVTDAISEFLFVTEKAGVKNLLHEGIDRGRIYLVGDTLIDALKIYHEKFDYSDILSKLEVKAKQFAVVTVHRPINTDDKKNLKKVLEILKKVSRYSIEYIDNFKIIFPAHPRTIKMIKTYNLWAQISANKNIIFSSPIGYTNFIKLLKECSFIITDSGGIQEEATFLKIPCLTLRESFERIQTVTAGTNTLCSLDKDLIMHKVNEIFEGKYKKGRIPQLMDGKASSRIVKILTDYLFKY